MPINNAHKNRIFWLDVARACAVLFVVLNHACGKVYDNYNNQIGEFFNSSFISQLFKAVSITISWLGVPLFLMITGSLILNKTIESDEDIKRFYSKNLFALFVATEIWTFMGYLFLTLFYTRTPATALESPVIWFLKLIFTMLFVNKVSFASLWYMSMILCIYLVLPIFCVYLSKFSLKSLRLPIFIVFISGFVVPTINKYLAVFEINYELGFDLTYAKIFSYFLIFVLSGYYIFNCGLKLKSNRFIGLNFLFWFCLTVGCQIYGYSRPYNLVTEYTSVGILISAVLLFELIRRYGDYLNGFSKWILLLSKSSFGIYMCHTFVMWTIHKMLPPIWINRPFTVICYAVISLSVSVLIVQLLAQVRWCRIYMLNMK